MKQIIEVGQEIKDLQRRVCIVYTIMATTIFFLSVLLAAAFFEVPYHWVVAIFAAVIFAYFYFQKLYSQQSILEVEAKTPELKEKLRTALDYATKENEIILELHKDVLSNIKKVKASHFINNEKLVKNILIAGILAVLVIFVTSLNVSFNPVDFAKRGGFRTLIEEFVPREREVTFGVLEESDIFGEEDVAELGDQIQKLQLNPEQGAIDLSNIEDVPERHFNVKLFPDAVQPSQESFYQENIPKENKELIKNYFNKLAQGG
ncbi:MAG: hypothetical protein QW331_01110 [Candidatus Woesearchaeota archaeon]